MDTLYGLMQIEGAAVWNYQSCAQVSSWRSCCSSRTLLSMTGTPSGEVLRYECRQALQQNESFSPQVDAHSMKLAEAVYEQTRGLGHTPLQGRLNYLHQLGKITLRDRSNSLLSLPQQREDIEFAVGHISDNPLCARAAFNTTPYVTPYVIQLNYTSVFLSLQSDVFWHSCVKISSMCNHIYKAFVRLFV